MRMYIKQKLYAGEKGYSYQSVNIVKVFLYFHKKKKWGDYLKYGNIEDIFQPMCLCFEV